MVGTTAAAAAAAAAQVIALHAALRTVCLTSDWTYSVFWTIRHRPRARGGSGGGNEDGSLMMMWEDGFCNEDRVRKAFSKMSIQLYNYGEGLMGKVASDKCHKWISLNEPTDNCEATNASCSQWQSSLDALPLEWTDQFESGIKTIVVIQAGHGLLQLGSNKIIQEDLHFVLRMRHTFESLGFQSGFYLSQLFSSIKQPSVFDWRFGPSPSTMGPPQLEIPRPKCQNISILIPNTTGGNQDNGIKWPTQTVPSLDPSSSREMAISPSPTSIDPGDYSDVGLIYADVMETL